MKAEIRHSDLFFCEEPMQLCSGQATPVSPHLINRDRLILGLKESATWGQICEGFLKSRAWFWLREAARESSSFGLLSSKLHRELGKNSDIRRKTVKKLLNNLLNWSMQILPGSVRVKRGRNQTMILLVESAGG